MGKVTHLADGAGSGAEFGEFGIALARATLLARRGVA
jgi:hypothetical protein